jgi:hypothetical protein
VTGDLAYWRQVVHDHHDLPAYGHPGISHTTALTECHYWWPACDKRFATMWADAQIASKTRSIHRQGKLCSHPSSQIQKQCRSRQSRWTSSLSCHSQTGSILYSRSPTTTAPRQPSSSHATRPLQPKESPNCTSNMCSNGSGSHRRSSATVTHDWPESSPGRCAPHWESPRTCQLRSTLGQTGNRNAPTKDWSNTCNSMSTQSKATGRNSYQ